MHPSNFLLLQTNTGGKSEEMKAVVKNKPATHAGLVPVSIVFLFISLPVHNNYQ